MRTSVGLPRGAELWEPRQGHTCRPLLGLGSAPPARLCPILLLLRGPLPMVSARGAITAPSASPQVQLSQHTATKLAPGERPEAGQGSLHTLLAPGGRRVQAPSRVLQVTPHKAWIRSGSWELVSPPCPKKSSLLLRSAGRCPPKPWPTVHPFCPSSPFKIKVLPAHDASKVRASGPGLNASGIPASLPVEFTIDARDAGEGLLTVQILVSPCLAHFPDQALGMGGP